MKMKTNNMIMKKKSILSLVSIIIVLLIGFTRCRKPEVQEIKEVPITSIAVFFPHQYDYQIVFSPDTFFYVPYNATMTLYSSYDNGNEDNNPNFPLYFPKGKIKAIHFYSDSAYDANHPAYTYWDDIMSIQGIHGNQNYYFNTDYDYTKPMRLDSFNMRHPHCEYVWLIKLLSPPDTVRKHHLTYSLDLVTGEHFEYISTKIPIQFQDTIY